MGDAELLERILHLAAGDVVDKRPDSKDEDAHFSQALAHTVISSYFSPCETLLDPFAGCGTTPVLAHRGSSQSNV